MQAILNIKTSAILSKEEFVAELLLAEVKANTQSKLRFHLNYPLWKLVDDITPEHNMEVMGFNEEWVDEDYNPDGICVCFLTDEKYWVISMWCGQHDEWHTRQTNEHDPEHFKTKVNPPTHWAYKILAPKKQ